jgi:hypothetical protein
MGDAQRHNRRRQARHDRSQGPDGRTPLAITRLTGLATGRPRASAGRAGRSPFTRPWGTLSVATSRDNDAASSGPANASRSGTGALDPLREIREARPRVRWAAPDLGVQNGLESGRVTGHGLSDHPAVEAELVVPRAVPSRLLARLRRIRAFAYGAAAWARRRVSGRQAWGRRRRRAGRRGRRGLAARARAECFQPQKGAGSYSRPTSRRSLQSETPRACPHRSSRSSSRSGRLATLPEWSVTQTWWPSGSAISTLSSLRFSRRQERSSAAGSSSAMIVMLPDCRGIPAAYVKSARGTGGTCGPSAWPERWSSRASTSTCCSATPGA